MTSRIITLGNPVFAVFAITAKVAMLAWLTVFATIAAAQDGSDSAEEAGVRAGTEAYFEAWTFTEEEGIDWDAFRQVFMSGPGGVSIVDDFGGEATVLDSADAYIETWSPVVAENFVSLTTTAEDGIEVMASGNVGVSTFILRAEGVRPNGEPGLLRQEATFVWQPDASGDWRLVREHLVTLPSE